MTAVALQLTVTIDSYNNSSFKINSCGSFKAAHPTLNGERLIKPLIVSIALYNSFKAALLKLIVAAHQTLP
jgi:hypothetical protein